MLSNVKNIFKVEDLRNKIFFTFMIVALYRIGAAIRVPGVDPLALADHLRQTLADAHATAARLVALLKGRKKEQKALAQVVSSLRSLTLTPDRE